MVAPTTEQFYDDAPAESATPGKVTTIMAKQASRVYQVEENGFFKAFIPAMPVALLLWAVIIWGVKAVFF